MIHKIGIAEYKISSDPEDVLTTHSLGSCVGLTMYDPVARIGGMVHCLLPLSRTNPEKAKQSPATFVDTGVMLLLKELIDLGVDKRKLIVKVAGAAQMLGNNNQFKMGERNYTVTRKILWKNRMLIDGERVGGSSPRTMTLYLNNGRVTTSTRRVEEDF